MPRRLSQIRSRVRDPSVCHSIWSIRYPSKPRIRVQSRSDPMCPLFVWQYRENIIAAATGEWVGPPSGFFYGTQLECHGRIDIANE
jgi:hypothetical protein